MDFTLANLANRDHEALNHSSDIEWVVRLIERYLELHPEAADGLDGVIRWWLARQCVEEIRAVAELALAEALRRGIIETRRGMSQEVIYVRADSRD